MESVKPLFRSLSPDLSKDVSMKLYAKNIKMCERQQSHLRLPKNKSTRNQAIEPRKSAEHVLMLPRVSVNQEKNAMYSSAGLNRVEEGSRDRDNSISPWDSNTDT